MRFGPVRPNDERHFDPKMRAFSHHQQLDGPGIGRGGQRMTGVAGIELEERTVLVLGMRGGAMMRARSPAGGRL